MKSKRLESKLSEYIEKYKVNPPIEIFCRKTQRYESDHARVAKSEKKWYIEIVGDNQTPMLFHEYLHIVLEGTGRLINFSRSNPKEKQYLFELKNLIDDYIIEMETLNEFGPDLSKLLFRYRFDNTSTDIFSFERNPIQTFMDILGIKCIGTNIYPEFKENPVVNFYGGVIKSPRFESILSELSKYDFSCSAQDYKKIVSNIHLILTDSNLKISDLNKPRIIPKDTFNEFLCQILNLYKIMKR